MAAEEESGEVEEKKEDKKQKNFVSLASLVNYFRLMCNFRLLSWFCS